MTRETMFTKIVAWLICAVMIIGMIPSVSLPASAAGDEWEGDIDVAETTEPPAGSDANHPIDLYFTWAEDNLSATATATVPAGKTFYFRANANFEGPMTISGPEGFDYIVGEAATPDEAGVVTTDVAINFRNPMSFAIYNAAEADGEYTFTLSVPAGTMLNPDQIVTCEAANVAAIKAGSQGYFYSFTAPSTGKVVVEISSNAGWTYTINNVSAGKYGDLQRSNSDPVVNPAIIDVTEGDVLEIVVNTYDPADVWNAPAGNVTLKVHANTKVENTATCETAGVKTITCNDCGAVLYEEAVSAHANLQYVAAVVPVDCSQQGHNEYWFCPDCNCYFGDAELSYQLNPAWIFYNGEHVRPDGSPACAVVECEVCGEESYGSEPCVPEGPACKDSTCVNCGEATYGYGCTYEDGLPLCLPGTCIYCGTEYANGIYEHENGAWATCLEGECSYGCGKVFPATTDHNVEDPCNGGLCDMCWDEIPAKGHKYEDVVTPPTATDKGYTTHTCSVCGDSYVDSYTDPTGPIVVANLKFAQVSLQFAEYIGVQPIMLTNVVQNYDSYYVEAVQYPAGSDPVVTILEPTSDSVAAYNVYVLPMLPRAMTDKLTLTIYAEKDGVKYQSATMETSIATLAKNKIVEYQGKNDIGACKVLVDLLNYGAEVKKGFNYDVDNLPNANLGELAAFGSQTNPEISAISSNTGSGAVRVYQNTLSMGSKVEVQFVFLANQVAGYELRYTLNGETTTIPASEFDTTSVAGAAVAIFALKPRNFRDQLTIGLYDPATDAPVSAVYTTSVEAYAKTNIDNGKYVALVNAMMNYGDSVLARFS